MKKTLIILIFAVLLMSGCQTAKDVTCAVGDAFVTTGKAVGKAGKATGEATTKTADAVSSPFVHEDEEEQ